MNRQEASAVHMGDYLAAQMLHELVCLQGGIDLGRAYEASVRFSQGVAHMHHQQWAAAAEQFRGVVELAPHHAGAHVRLCVALAHLGRLAEAQRCLGRALRLNPGEPKLMSMRRLLRDWRAHTTRGRVRAPTAGTGLAD